MKKILFVASEAVPFIKTGGLADVVGALPKCFDKKYFDVRVIIPKYLCMKEEYKNQLQYVTHFYMDIGYRREYVGIMQLEYDGIKFYFIDNEYYAYEYLDHAPVYYEGNYYEYDNEQEGNRGAVIEKDDSLTELPDEMMLNF